MKKCIGCGVELQDQNSDLSGYVKDMSQDYCMRCFRLTHYGDLTLDMKDAIDPDELLEKIKSYKNVGIVFIIDILHLSSSVNQKIFENLRDYPIIVIINKLDLLPDNTYFPKLEAYCQNALKKVASNNKIKSIILTNYKDNGLNQLLIDDLKHLPYEEFLFIGLANAGKSTILNKLIEQPILTTSFYPGTTLAFNTYDFLNLKLIDTPGLVDNGSILMHLSHKDLALMVPKKTIKPLIFQVYQNQTFFIEGILQLDVYCNHNASVIFYFDPSIKIHRCKMERADNYISCHPELFEKGYKLSSASFSKMDHQDLCINGLGFISFRKIDKIKITVPERVEVTKRKGLL